MPMAESSRFGVLGRVTVSGAVVVRGSGDAVARFIEEVETRADPELRIVYLRVQARPMRIVAEGR